MSENSNIPIRNLYYLLAYAFPNLNWKDYQWESRKNSVKEQFEDVYNFFAWWLSESIENQRKRGLYRQYECREENLSSLHGKINMPGTIRNYLARRQLLSCEYDELSENNLLNQILKTTAIRLIKSGMVDQEWKTKLRKEMLFFSNVDTTDLRSIKWAEFHYQKSNKSYRELIAVCQFILEGIPSNMSDKTTPKVDYFSEKNMPKLYEKFIFGYYKKEHPELKVYYQEEIKWAGVAKEEIGMLPKMKTDVILGKENNFLIIDAKFYAEATQENYESEKIHSENLYQIFTYVKNKDADYALKDLPHKVAGMLLYAATGKEVQPEGSWNMSGNLISAKTLDLNCEFAAIKCQLNKISNDYFGTPKY